MKLFSRSLLCLTLAGISAGCLNGEDEHVPPVPCDDADVPDTDASPDAGIPDVDAGPDAPPAQTYSFCASVEGGISQGCCTNGSFTQVGWPETGMWIRGVGAPTVYYYASDGKRYVFPTRWTIVSWSYGFSDARLIDGSADACANVVQVPDAALASIPIGGNVRYRPGSFATGLESDPSRWVVAHGGTLRRLAAPEMVEDIYYPEAAEDRTRLLPDAFLTNYLIGDPVSVPAQFNAAAEFAQANIECETVGCGSLTYALEPGDAESDDRLVVGGSTNVVLARYRVMAQGRAQKFMKAPFRLTDPSALQGLVHVTVWNGAVQLGPTVVPDASGFINFTDMHLIVPQDDWRMLTVRGALNQVGLAGANSGIDVGVTFCSGDNSQGCWNGGTEYQSNGTFEVRSASTDAVIDTIGNSGNVQGHEKILRKTVPTVTAVSLPSKTLGNGTQVIAKFTVTADAAGDLPQKSVAFELVLNDVGGSALAVAAPAIREVGQGTDIPSTSRPATVNCTGSMACAFSVTFGSEQVIAAGASKTYELRVNVTGADTANESVSTRLLGDTERVTDSLAGLHGEALNTPPYYFNFIWSDRSGIPHNDVVGGSRDWTNGRLVRGLPTDFQTLVRF